MGEKFIVTGSFRSGTTYASSILNSQQDTFCLEDYPWFLFPKKFKNREDFLRLSNYLDAKFSYLGLEKPRLAERARVDDNLTDMYILHLRDIFNCKNIGFKKTMLTKAEMIDRINDGYKIIILKRDTKEILKSWVNRIDTNIYHSADTLFNWLKDIDYYQPGIPKETYIIISYEEMISNLDKTLNNLSKFLNLKIENTKVLYYSFQKNRSTFDGNSSFFYSSRQNLMLENLTKKYDSEIFEQIAKQINNKNYKPSLKFKLINFFYTSYKKIKKLRTD